MRALPERCSTGSIYSTTATTTRRTTGAPMSSSTSVRRVARKTAPLVLFATILWPVAAFGGVYSWAYVPLIALCGLFAFAAFLGEGWRVGALHTGCLAAVAVAVALQLVP